MLAALVVGALVGWAACRHTHAVRRPVPPERAVSSDRRTLQMARLDSLRRDAQRVADECAP